MSHARVIGVAIVALATWSGAPRVSAQPAEARPDFALDAAARSEVIERVVRGVRTHYVLPSVGEEMEKTVRALAAKGNYEEITSASALAEKLTNDLRSVSKDKHLRVKLSPPRPAKGASGGSPAEIERDMRDSMMRVAQRDNAGFSRVERLEGNVGYIEVVMFYPPEIAAEKAAIAMNQLSDTDALIIDLRRNGGGDPEMVALFVSYFLEAKRTLVNTFVNREGKVARETWTTPDLPASRFLGKDVYILTSSRTFSAAEEFVYDLKNLKRATIIGETTGGGANPVDTFRINDHFDIVIPVDRAVNPITQTNWEGTGVEPDLKVPAPNALETALQAHQKKLAAAVPSSQAR